MVGLYRYEFAISGWTAAMTVQEPTGKQLFLEILERAEVQSIIVQIQAGFMDVAQIIESHPDLFEGFFVLSTLLCLTLPVVLSPVSFSPLPFSLAHRVSLLFLCVSLYAQASCALLKAIVHDHSLVCCRKGGMVDNHGWLETGWWRMGCRFCTKQCV